MTSTISEVMSTGSLDGPEEGEIVSDDLEDISDESFTFNPCNGKSLSRSDHLHALSLSSVTDLEEPLPEKRRKRKNSFSHRHPRRRKRSRRKLIDSDSSDDDTTLDRRLKLQLKAAVRVNVEEAHRNSLRTRLKAMVQSTSGPDSDCGTAPEPKPEENNLDSVVNSSETSELLPQKETSVIEILSDSESIQSIPENVISAPEVSSSTPEVPGALENPESGSDALKDEIDNELIQLRIEALKTAINNKFANRKRRKKENVGPTSSDDTNKENNSENTKSHNENQVKIPEISPQSNETENNVPPSPDEDEDVLRALLLASMSKKITSIEPESTKTTVGKVQSKPVIVNYNKVTVSKRTNNTNNFKLNNVKKVVNNVKTVVNKASGATKLVKVPQVKPLIINVNSDSDSDLDFGSSPEKSPKKPQKSLERDTSVVPPTEVPKNLEAALESSVEKFLKEQRAKVESQIQVVDKPTSEVIPTVIETKKTLAVTHANNKNKLEPSLVAKKINLNTNKISLGTNKISTNAKKITHILNTTPQNSKNILLADLEKSALKFLPENKREEYKQLQNLLRLRRAQLKKPRVRRISQRITDNNNSKMALQTDNKNQVATKVTSQISNKISLGNETLTVSTTQDNDVGTAVTEPKKKVTKTKLINKAANTDTVNKMDSTNQLLKLEARNQERRSMALRVETRNQERKSDALLLHTTLKQMQTRKEGRLQIQDRYKSLRPLVKKINDVSKEQKSWDQQVKRLLEQLSEARKKQHEVHQTMSKFVKELADRKLKMDESAAAINNKPKISNLITSTPIKPNISDTTLEISVINSLTTNLSTTDSEKNKSVENTLLVKQSTDPEPKEISEQNNGSSKLCDTLEQSTKIANNGSVQMSDVKRVVSDTDLHVEDPNDIDKIIRKTEEKKAVLDKKQSFEGRRSEKVRYVSPLDSVKRMEDFDPFAIMCPFEVNGMCKDTECTYKHLPK